MNKKKTVTSRYKIISVIRASPEVGVSHNMLLAIPSVLKFTYIIIYDIAPPVFKASI